MKAIIIAVSIFLFSSCSREPYDVKYPYSDRFGYNNDGNYGYPSYYGYPGYWAPSYKKYYPNSNNDEYLKEQDVGKLEPKD